MVERCNNFKIWAISFYDELDDKNINDLLKDVNKISKREEKNEQLENVHSLQKSFSSIPPRPILHFKLFKCIYLDLTGL